MHTWLSEILSYQTRICFRNRFIDWKIVKTNISTNISFSVTQIKWLQHWSMASSVKNVFGMRLVWHSDIVITLNWNWSVHTLLEDYVGKVLWKNQFKLKNYPKMVILYCILVWKFQVIWIVLEIYPKKLTTHNFFR